MRLCILIALVCLGLPAIAQQPFIPNEQYIQLRDSAFGLYLQKHYDIAAPLYNRAFAAAGNNGTIDDRYNAACTWALAGNPEKAFYQLTKAVVELRWSNVEHMTKDTDLQSLHNDKRWEQLVGAATSNLAIKNAKLDKPLAQKLDSIYTEDQFYRLQIDSVSKQYGWQSPNMAALMKTMQQKDSSNLVFVKSIIDTKGWLGADKVGQKGNSTIFLVIQHADSATQEQYLPVMREAVTKGNAQPADLALLEDRTRTNRGEKQLYGSQLRMNPATKKYEFFPIEDEPNVNKRRAAMGLGSLEAYARLFGLEYHVKK